MLILENRQRRFVELLQTKFDNNKAAMQEALEIDKSHMSQILKSPIKGPGSRPLGEKAARDYEEKLGLPPYWLDKVSRDVGEDHLCTEASDRVLVWLSREELTRVRAFLAAWQEPA